MPFELQHSLFENDPTMLQQGMLSRFVTQYFAFRLADEVALPLYRKRKNRCNFERNYYNVIYKRRKFCNPSSVLTSDGGVSSGSISNLPEKNGEKSCPSRMLNGGSSFTGHQVTSQGKDSHCTKSFCWITAHKCLLLS